MFRFLTFVSLSIIFLLTISTKSYAVTNIQNDSTNRLLLSNNGKLKNLFNTSLYAFETGDDVAITTKSKDKIKGIITQIENDKIYISTKDKTIETIDIQELKTIKRYKERHLFFVVITMSFGILLLLIGLIGLVIMIDSYINLDTGSNFFPILGSTSFILLDIFLGYKLLKSSEKRLSPRKKFRIGKKWSVAIQK